MDRYEDLIFVQYGNDYADAASQFVSTVQGILYGWVLHFLNTSTIGKAIPCLRQITRFTGLITKQDMIRFMPSLDGTIAVN